jgi:hypothetical protein
VQLLYAGLAGRYGDNIARDTEDVDAAVVARYDPLLKHPAENHAIPDQSIKMNAIKWNSSFQ